MWDNSAFNHKPNISPGWRITDRNWMRSALPPLCVPHVTAPLAADPGPLLCHRPFGSAPQMCDTVTFNPLKWLTLCVNVHASVSLCVCVQSFFVFLSSSLCCLPLAGHHTDSGTSSHLHPLRRDLKITTRAVIFFALALTWLEFRCRPQESRSRRTAINHSRMLRPQPAGTPRS